jgi:NitT/TauT family transport system substrate-binding protein
MTNEDTLAKDPALVRGFVAAFTHGLADALADPEAAYTISAKFVQGLTDPAIEKQVLAATLALCQTDHLGRSDPAAWENMQSALLAAGLLTEQQDVSKAYTNDFVP